MTSFFGIKMCGFFSKTTRRIYAKFFSGFRRKHLFITTCIEKQCTRPLNPVSGKSYTALQMVRQRFNIDANNCVVLALSCRDWHRNLFQTSQRNTASIVKGLVWHIKRSKIGQMEANLRMCFYTWCSTPIVQYPHATGLLVM